MPHWFPQWLYQSSLQPAMNKLSSFPVPMPACAVICILIGIRWNFKEVLISIPLMAQDVEVFLRHLYFNIWEFSVYFCIPSLLPLPTPDPQPLHSSPIFCPPSSFPPLASSIPSWLLNFDNLLLNYFLGDLPTSEFWFGGGFFFSAFGWLSITFSDFTELLRCPWLFNVSPWWIMCDCHPLGNVHPVFGV